MLGVRGKALSDRAHYGAAIGLLWESVATARRCGDVRQAAWSLAILGRALLLCGQWPEVVEVLDDSLALVRAEGWVAFQPFPEALRAEVALRQGDPDRAIALLDHAFALGCRIGDPCWEAMAARTRGLLRGAAKTKKVVIADNFCRLRSTVRTAPECQPQTARPRLTVCIKCTTLDLVGLGFDKTGQNVHFRLSIAQKIAPGRGADQWKSLEEPKVDELRRRSLHKVLPQNLEL